MIKTSLRSIINLVDRPSHNCLSLSSLASKRHIHLNTLHLLKPKFNSTLSSTSNSSLQLYQHQSMPDQISLTFLGTAAGKPSTTRHSAGRNVSCLAMKLDNKIWVVDAGEGTQHQFMRSNLKMSNVTKIFVTHMHGDHVNGVVGLLCTISAGEGGVLPGEIDPRTLLPTSTQPIPPTEIYGPSGIREFIRMNLKLTQSYLSRPYIVHELLFEGEEEEKSENLHSSELENGRNIRQNKDIDGTWDVEENTGGFEIHAGPILHTINCIGYIFNEHPRAQSVNMSNYLPHLKNPINVAALKASGISNPLSLIGKLTTTRIPITLADGTILSPPLMGGFGRKIVILGDTYDASKCEKLAEGADLVVHESTNAYMPDLDESQSKESVTMESVRETAKDHGHSTPEIAGEFAKRVGAKRLVLNHLSVKYMPVGEFLDGESESTSLKRKLLERISDLASEVWGGGKAIVAYDFLEIDVPRRKE